MDLEDRLARMSLANRGANTPSNMPCIHQPIVDRMGSIARGGPPNIEEGNEGGGGSGVRAIHDSTMGEEIIGARGGRVDGGMELDDTFRQGAQVISAAAPAVECLCCEWVLTAETTDVNGEDFVCQNCNSRAHFNCAVGTDYFKICSGHGWLCFKCCGAMSVCHECGTFDWSNYYCERCAAEYLSVCSNVDCGRILCKEGCRDENDEYVLQCPLCNILDQYFCCGLNGEPESYCMTTHFAQTHQDQPSNAWQDMV